MSGARSFHGPSSFQMFRVNTESGIHYRGSTRAPRFGARPAGRATTGAVVAPERDLAVPDLVDRHERVLQGLARLEVPRLGVLDDDGVSFRDDAVDIVFEASHRIEPDAQAPDDGLGPDGALVRGRHVFVEPVLGDEGCDPVEVFAVEAIPHLVHDPLVLVFAAHRPSSRRYTRTAVSWNSAARSSVAKPFEMRLNAFQSTP